MDSTGIPNKSFLGKILQFPLRLLPRGLRAPILQGPLRGRWWIVGSSPHEYWLGSFEVGKRELVAQTVTPGSVFFDLGGNVGYYSLLASVLVGPEGRVFTIEPLPRNLQFLREHLRINRIRNVTVLDAAVSDRSGTAWFEETDGTSRGHIDARGTIAVQTVALDDLVESGGWPLPQFLKIDIEGAELGALHGARRIVEDAHPAVFLSTHSTLLHAQCCEWLGTMGYTIHPIDGKPLERSRDILAVSDRR